jgi:signal transduction histidine kinase
MVTRGFTGRQSGSELSDRIPPRQHLVDKFPVLTAGPTPRIEPAEDASGGVLVAVQDSGPGLNPKSFNRMFDAFYTTKPDGMGMGLSICRSIVEAHGGRIWASSTASPGATIEFTLPKG